jgi:hypothetical protein
MHWNTYGRLVTEYHNLLELWDLDLSRRTAALVGMADEADILGQMLGEELELYRQQPARLPVHLLDDWEDDWDDEDLNTDNRRTLGETAKAAGVPYAFAKEAEREGLIRPDAGRGKQRKRFRPKLASWLGKLYTLREAGVSWDELRAWTRRRFQPGHESEMRWPDEYQPAT